MAQTAHLILKKYQEKSNGFSDAGDGTPRTAGRRDPWPKAWSWVIGQGRPRPPPYLEVSAVITGTLPHVSARGRWDKLAHPSQGPGELKLETPAEKLASDVTE
jgi:hypothetical protein